MKKKAMLGLALACAMCFTVSLAACGNNDAVVPDTTKVTEEVWQTQAAAFAEATNFTLDRVSVETGKSVGMMKLDGAVYYEAWGDEEGVYTLENGTYYHYTKADASAPWERDETSQSDYEDRIESPKYVILYAAGAVADAYASFTFDDKTGVYSAAELSIGEDATLKDVEVLMSGGKISKVVCTLVGGYEGDGDERVTIDHIGTTKITVPTKYNDDEGGSGSKPNPDAPGQTVGDAKAWEMAINASAENFTVETSLQGMDVTIKVADDKVEETQSATGMNISVFIVKEGDVYTTYAPYGDGSKWVKTTDTSGSLKEVFDGMKSLVTVLADHFSDFTLKDGKYVCDKELELTINGSTAHVTEIEADFATGKLVSLKYTASVEIEGQIAISTYTFSDFGTTEVEIPTKNIVEN